VVAWALEEPEGSLASSTSSFFSFLGPPPNMEKTLSLTAAAAEVAASVAFSVTGLSSLEVVAGLSSLSAALSVVTFAVSSLTRVAPGLATCSAAGSGLATSDMMCEIVEAFCVSFVWCAESL